MRAVFLALIMAGLSGLPASAQDRGALIDAFSGQWFVFEPEYAAGFGSCSLSLARGGPDARLAVTREGCSEALPPVTAWDVEGGTLRLFDADGAMRAELGGTPRRVTGTTLPDNRGIVVERATGDGTGQAIALAVQRHRCFYLGLTADCAPASELAAPTFSGPDGLAEITTLGNLVARSQPRRDAPTVGTLPANICIRVNQCLSASDGLWCRARFGDVTAWLSKTALRQGEWPIVTWQNGCAPSDS